MDMVIKKYKTFYKQNVNTLLQGLKCKDVFYTSDPEHDEDLLGEYCEHDDRKEAIVTFWVPFLRKTYFIYDIEKFVKKMTDAFYVYGYNLSFQSGQQTYVMINGQNVNIIVERIQFEAIYSPGVPEMAKILYHVTPARFINKIKERGLVPLSKSYTYCYPHRIYLFNAANAKEVIRYGSIKTRTLQLKDSNTYTDDSHFYILRLKRDDLLNYRYDNGKKKLVFSYQNIPRELIQDTCMLYEVQDNATVKRISLNYKFK